MEQEDNFEQSNEVPVSPEYLAIAMAPPNRKYVADQVSRRLGPSGSRTFKYWKEDEHEAFTLPDSGELGKYGKASEFRPKADPVDSSVKNYGFSEPVSNEDITDNALPGKDPIAKAILRNKNRVSLARELRVAKVYQDPANYLGSNQTVLSGNTQLSHVDSDPIGQLREYLATPIVRPNRMGMSLAVWNKLCVHPKVVSAALGNNGTNGVATRQRLAELLEIEELVIGQSLITTNVKGQAATLAPAWGKHIFMTYDDPTADNQGGYAYGWTYEFGNLVVKIFEVSTMGLHGGKKVLVGESVKEEVTAKSAGFLVRNAVA